MWSLSLSPSLSDETAWYWSVNLMVRSSQPARKGHKTDSVFPFFNSNPPQVSHMYNSSRLLRYQSRWKDISAIFRLTSLRNVISLLFGPCPRRAGRVFFSVILFPSSEIPCVAVSPVNYLARLLKRMKRSRTRNWYLFFFFLLSANDGLTLIIF